MKNITRKAAVMALGMVATSQTMLSQVQVSANFSKWVEYPLVKKIGVYQTPLTCEKWIQRDFPKMAQIESRALRYEFAWGKDLYGTDAIGGILRKPTYNFSKADFMFDKARENTQAFVFAHGYMPSFLQSATGNNSWQSPPSDYDVWQTVNRDAAAHWKDKGYSNRYVEVWNEPDLPNGFFSGTLDDYLKIYQYAALGAKQGDADCKVGGPAIAYSTWWYDSLVDLAKRNSLPIDFLSGHAYGESFTWELDAMRSALNTFGNKETEMLLTEYSPYAQVDYAANGKVERAEAAMTFFNALPTMLEYPDLTYVTWAQYIDPEEGTSGHAYASWDKLGLVDGNNGCRKALFNAFRLYGMMPADRCDMSTGSLKGMSSADEDHVASVLWNTTEKGKKIRFRMNNLPFKEGIVETYHIDKTHNSWYENANDELVPTLFSREEFSGNSYTINDSVRGQGVFFVRISSLNAAPSFPNNNFATLVRTHQWYATRANTAAYAQFDSKTWTAYLSTNNQSTGWAITGVTADNVPETFTVRSKNSGNLKDSGNNSALCFRVDYQSKDGTYRKSVLFHGGLYHKERTNTIPWGTKKSPDVVEQVDDFGEFTVSLKKYQPADFSGRVILTFDMSNTGLNAKADIQVLSSSLPSLSAVQVDSLSEGTAKLSVRMVGNTTGVKKTGFVLAIDNDPLVATSPQTFEAEMDGNIFSAIIPSLTKQKNYHVRGFADEIYTSENMFYTSQLATVLTTTIKADKEQLTATINGSISSENGSSVIERGFVWCKGTDYEPTVEDNAIKVGSGKGTYKYTMSGLEKECDYSVRAYGINRAGIAYGRTKTFTTKTVDVIEDIIRERSSSDNHVYTISGHPSDKSHRGIIISDGRKMFVR